MKQLTRNSNISCYNRHFQKGWCYFPSETDGNKWPQNAIFRLAQMVPPTECDLGYRFRIRTLTLTLTLILKLTLTLTITITLKVTEIYAVQTTPK